MRYKHWLPYDRIGAIGATLAVAGTLILIGRFLAGLPAVARSSGGEP
jgi:hypothetical protein